MSRKVARGQALWRNLPFAAPAHERSNLCTDEP